MKWEHSYTGGIVIVQTFRAHAGYFGESVSVFDPVMSQLLYSFKKNRMYYKLDFNF